MLLEKARTLGTRPSGDLRKINGGDADRRYDCQWRQCEQEGGITNWNWKSRVDTTTRYFIWLWLGYRISGMERVRTGHVAVIDAVDADIEAALYISGSVSDYLGS